MIFCGIKYTHDASWTLLENNVLLEHIELEKVGNNPRCPDWIYCDETEEKYLLPLFKKYSPLLAVDGWSGNNAPHFPVAPYTVIHNIQNKYYRYGPFIYKGKYYFSYPHITTHLISSYCLSPFSKSYRKALVTVWDGGCPAFLFMVQPKKYDRSKYYLDIQYLDIMHPYDVGFFPRLGNFFGPRKKKENEHPSDGFLGVRKELRHHDTATGTFMAYAGLGKYIQDIEPLLLDILDHGYNQKTSWDRVLPSLQQYSDEDIFATAFSFFGQSFQQNLLNYIERYSEKLPLILSGGAALNIKWNSSLRDTGHFSDVWTSPIPSDAGSSLGAACAEMIYHLGTPTLEWDVYKGPCLPHSQRKGKSCSLKHLAHLLYTTNEPIVFMSGNAEIGPRALGHRSILGNPLDPDMKHKLNTVKGRESFRPVAPICLEQYLSDFFSPGIPDPYMVFEQMIRPEYIPQLRSITHVDGTSRVQSINKDTESDLYTLLEEYRILTGFPILCNTSANLPGRGFFPNLDSVFRWGKVRYCWYNGELFDCRG